FSKITGNVYGHVEKYRMDGAEAVIITMSSAAGTAKTVVDKMRGEGKKVGLLKLRTFRPFPYAEVAEAISDAKHVGVLDRALSFGAHAPLYGEVIGSLYDRGIKVNLQSYVFGLGGRELFNTDIEGAFKDLLTIKASGGQKYLGLRE
ncbi:MAG: pyruvate ferredoxin oxidoreductase, partial [Candidatus Altiarchaeota archaeon]|nr:pyruvate ferredoxin oxidoreductase [Candidatus Altiarchaeota archaeon]